MSVAEKETVATEPKYLSLSTDGFTAMYALLYKFTEANIPLTKESIMIINTEGKFSLLCYALYRHDLKLATALIEAGANVNYCADGPKKTSPMYWAIKYFDKFDYKWVDHTAVYKSLEERSSVAMMLFEKGFKPTKDDSYLLIYALDNALPNVVQKLLSFKTIDVNTKTPDDMIYGGQISHNTPFTRAVTSYNFDVALDLIVNHKADSQMKADDSDNHPILMTSRMYTGCMTGQHRSKENEERLGVLLNKMFEIVIESKSDSKELINDLIVQNIQKNNKTFMTTILSRYFMRHVTYNGKEYDICDLPAAWYTSNEVVAAIKEIADKQSS